MNKKNAKFMFNGFIKQIMKFYRKITLKYNQRYLQDIYHNYILSIQMSSAYSSEFVKFKQNNRSESKVKYIAFYLTQFHKSIDNDNWWGKNYTEWDSVVKSVPRYKDHYQPHLPVDIGFYNLLDKNTWLQQVEIANNYGVSGFCFYFYWFNGRRVLDKPLELFLNNKDIDIEFCFFWANESWTRTWHGVSDNNSDKNEMLIEQIHNHDDDRNLMEYLCKNVFCDTRYIFLENKPLLVIYNVELFPDIKKTTQIWQQIAIDHGFSGIHLSFIDNSDEISPLTVGFDSVVQFSPKGLKCKKKSNIKALDGKVRNKHIKVFSYEDAVYSEKDRVFNNPTFRSCFMSWDNEARRSGNGISWYGSTPSLFENYLLNMTEYAIKNPICNESFVFINAWNEWAEGAHLEPDRKYGYAWLDKVRKCSSHFI